MSGLIVLFILNLALTYYYKTNNPELAMFNLHVVMMSGIGIMVCLDRRGK